MTSAFIRRSLVTAATVATIVVAIYIFIAYQIYAALTDIWASASAQLSLPRFLAVPIGFLLTWVISKPLIGFTGKLLLGKATPWTVAAAVLASAVVVGIWANATRDWMFDSDGKPLQYVCPPLFPGGSPRLQRVRADHEKGGLCKAVDSATATRILVSSKSGQISRVIPNTVDELLEIPRFDSYGPILLAGVSSQKGGPPRLYRGRAGIDPYSNGLLRPATDDDINRVASHLGWTKYFPHDIDERYPLIIIVGDVDESVRSEIYRHLSHTQFWDEEHVRGRAFVSSVVLPILNNKLKGLARPMFPPSLKTAIFVRPINQLLDGRWYGTVVKLNLDSWQFERTEISVFGVAL